MGKRLISLALVICMILTIIPFSIQAAEKSEWKPSTNDGWNMIDFNDTTNYKGDQYKISVTSAADGWHYSGGYWKFTLNSVNEAVIIKDSDMQMLSKGTLESEAISKYLTATVELPTKVKEHLRNGGSLSDIKVKFDTNNIKYSDIFSGDCYYKIEGDKLKVSFKPIFNVSDEAIYGKKQDSRMSTEIPQGKPGYSYTLYAIWSKDGVDLGVGYSKEAKMSGDSTILNIPDNRFIEAPEDIADATGSLKQNGKDYFYKDKFTGEVKKLDPTKVGIGNGTFQGGGAVGLMFLFPINATFYIDDGTNYVLIANGFVNDNTASVIDFIDTYNLLEDPLLGDLTKVYVELAGETFNNYKGGIAI